MPCLLEQNHARQWLLYGLRMWCLAVSWLLGLRSYLLGDVASSSEVIYVTCFELNKFILSCNITNILFGNFFYRQEEAKPIIIMKEW